MIRRRLLMALLTLGLVFGSLLWLPARIIEPLLPPSAECGVLKGTVWRGQCDDLRIRGSRSGSIAWALGLSIQRPLTFPVRLRWTKDSSVAEGTLQAALFEPTSLELESVSIELESLRNALPADVFLGSLAGVDGQIDASGLRLQFDTGRLSALHGEATLTRATLLKSGAHFGPIFGRFDGRSGTVRDRGGPLEFNASVVLVAPGAFTAQVRVLPRVAGVLPGLPAGIPIEADVEGRL